MPSGFECITDVKVEEAHVKKADETLGFKFKPHYCNAMMGFIFY